MKDIIYMHIFKKSTMQKLQGNQFSLYARFVHSTRWLRLRIFHCTEYLIHNSQDRADDNNNIIFACAIIAQRFESARLMKWRLRPIRLRYDGSKQTSQIFNVRYVSLDNLQALYHIEKLKSKTSSN